VAGWPGLLVDGYDEIITSLDFVPAVDTLELVRMDRLSANVLLCLFSQEVQTVDIHQKPETLHFGLDVSNGGFRKALRDADGILSGVELQSVSWRDQTRRVIDVAGLASQMQQTLGWATFTAAQFALEMIEGVQKVRFRRSAT